MLGSFSRACWSLSRYQSTQAEGADAVMQSEEALPKDFDIMGKAKSFWARRPFFHFLGKAP